MTPCQDISDKKIIFVLFFSQRPKSLLKSLDKPFRLWYHNGVQKLTYL